MYQYAIIYFANRFLVTKRAYKIFLILVSDKSRKGITIIYTLNDESLFHWKEPENIKKMNKFNPIQLQIGQDF